MFKRILIYPLVLISAMGSVFFLRFSPKMEKNARPDTIFGDFMPIVVLELFTSQGCSSCPPADALLNKVKSRHGVFALSYHVDYWDYIGWKDPFGKSSHSDKQRAYNLKFRSKSNYTPQLVVNGREHFVGSNTTLVNKSIAVYQKQKAANGIEIHAVAKNKQKVTFDYEVSGNVRDKQVQAVLVIGQRTTSVKQGENRNRTLTNSNIVVAEKNIPASFKRNSEFIEIPDIVNVQDKLELVLLVKNDDLGITGATKVPVE